MESNGTFLDPQINQGVRQKTDAPSGKYGRQGAPVRWFSPVGSPAGIGYVYTNNGSGVFMR